jgi:hypothetical protein
MLYLYQIQLFLLLPSNVIGVLTPVGRDASVAAYCPVGPLGTTAKRVPKCPVVYQHLKGLPQADLVLEPGVLYITPPTLHFGAMARHPRLKEAAFAISESKTMQQTSVISRSARAPLHYILQQQLTSAAFVVADSLIRRTHRQFRFVEALLSTMRSINSPLLHLHPPEKQKGFIPMSAKDFNSFFFQSNNLGGKSSQTFESLEVVQAAVQDESYKCVYDLVAPPIYKVIELL